MKRESFQIWRFLSSAGLVASAAENLATFFGIRIQAAPVFMVMVLLVTVPFGAGLIYANRVAPDRKEWFKVSAFAPRWLKVLSGILLVYALAYSAMIYAGRERGMDEKRGEKYVLVNKSDKVIREITEQEYNQRRLQTARAASAMLMFFSSVGLMFLVAARNLARERGQLGEASKES